MKPSVGRIVHYATGTRGHLAAIIVRLEEGATRENVGLTVFGLGEVIVYHASDVPHDEDTKAPGTWHWPERED